MLLRCFSGDVLVPWNCQQRLSRHQQAARHVVKQSDLQVRLMKVEPQVLLGLSSECLNERRCPELRRGQLAIKVVASVWLSSTPAPAQCGYHTWNCTQCGYHTENCTRSFRQHLRGAARLPITHSAVNTSPAAELRGYECGGNCSHRV